MRSDKLRQRLFDIYSQNWSLVRPLYTFNELDARITNDFKKATMCPLCMHIFNDSALNQQSSIPLTLEHCPPEELGGKPKVLLCKNCNSTTGYKLDVKLMEYLNVKPFNNKEHKSSVLLKNAVLKSDSLDVKGSMVLKRENDHTFSFDLKADDHYRKDRLDKILKESQFQIEYKPHETPSAHLVQTALLKIGYLLAFHEFGHILILNHNYDNLRYQILNPEKRVLLTKGVSHNISLAPGFYLVNQPIYAKGLLVVFEVVRNGRVEKTSVFLNHPETKDIVFYAHLKRHEGETFKIEKEDFVKLDYLMNTRNMGLFYEAIMKPYKINLNKLGLDFLDT